MENNAKWKQYKREFNSLDIFFDTLYILTKDENQNQLRIPLSCILDYKGYRCMAVGLVPFDEYALKVGLNIDNKFLHHQPFMSILSDAGQILGLEEAKVVFGTLSGHQNIPISTSIKVYLYQQTENSDDEHRDSPTNKSKDHHFFELQYEVKQNQDLGYVFNTSSIFPLDYDVNEFNGSQDKYLRAEFLCQYDRPIKADSRKKPPEGVENRAKEDQINEASKTLQTKIIPNLVNLLDSLTLVPLDSRTLTEIFHSYGVNMRYLGRIALYSNLFHVQDICINEMITRILKQLLNAQIAANIRDLCSEDGSSEHSDFSRHSKIIPRKTKGIMKKVNSKNDLKYQRSIDKTVGFQDGMSVNTSIDKKNPESLEEEVDYGVHILHADKCKEWYQDYFNLAFGIDEESIEFYNEVVFPRVNFYYDYPLERLEKYQINFTALYYSLIYH